MSQHACEIVKLRDDPLLVVHKCNDVERWVIEVDEIDNNLARVIITDKEKDKRVSRVVRRQHIFDLIVNKTGDLSLARYIDKVLYYKERREMAEELLNAPVIEAKVDSVIWPRGLAEKYFFLTSAGWRKVYVDQESGQVMFDAAEVEAPKWAPRVEDLLTALYHLPPGDKLDIDVVYNTDQLLEEVAQYISTYVTMRREYVAVAAVWALLSHARHALPYAEMLIVRKSGFGSGGTTAANVISLISARPLRPAILPSAASVLRIFHYIIPTFVWDEIRVDAAGELIPLLRLIAETAFDARNVTFRVEETKIAVYRTYGNVIAVDTSLEMTSLSSERRAWQIRIERDPNRATNILYAERDARELSKKLYAWGLTWPLIARSYIEQHAWQQGIGALNALRLWLEARGIRSEVVEAAYETVRRLLSEAYEAAIITDPVRRIIAAVEEVVAEAGEYVRNVGTIPSGWRLSEDGECLEIYLDTLRRKVREKLRYLHEITVQYEKAPDGSLVESVKQSQWYRVDPDVEPYLREMRKFLAILRTMGYTVYYDNSRHYRVKICSQ